MKTLHEIKAIDRYLHGKLPMEERLLLEALMVLDPALKWRVECQRTLYSIVKVFGRRQIKSEAERIHHQLFHDPANEEFKKRVLAFFQKQN
jgi:hypothetical protein